MKLLLHIVWEGPGRYAITRRHPKLPHKVLLTRTDDPNAEGARHLKRIPAQCVGILDMTVPPNSLLDKETKMNAHPEWMARLLAQLRELWPLDRTLNVMLQGEYFWTHYGYPTADGLCQTLPELIQIHIRDTAEDTEYWRGVLLHEYAHAILAPLTECADQSPAYVAAGEMCAKRLGGVLDFALRMRAETIEAGK